MGKKGLVVLVLILCMGLLLTGCPKKTVVKEEPSMKKADEAAAEREKAAKLAAEQETALLIPAEGWAVVAAVAGEGLQIPGGVG